MQKFVKSVSSYLSESKLFENAGLIVDVGSKDILKYVAWL